MWNGGGRNFVRSNGLWDVIEMELGAERPPGRTRVGTRSLESLKVDSASFLRRTPLAWTAPPRASWSNRNQISINFMTS